MELTNFNHGVGQNSYHLVWKPKYCWDIFKFSWVKKDCEAILGEAAKRYGMHIYELEVMHDHVHCFLEIPPTMSVSKALPIISPLSFTNIPSRNTDVRAIFDLMNMPPLCRNCAREKSYVYPKE